MKEAHALLTEEQKKAAEAAAALEKEYEKEGAAWTNLNSIGATYTETIAALDPLLVEQVEHYVQAGAKVSDLATAYKDELTPGQIDAIDKMVKANEKYAESWEKTQRDIDRTWDEALSTERENGLKGLALQLSSCKPRAERKERRRRRSPTRPSCSRYSSAHRTIRSRRRTSSCSTPTSTRWRRPTNAQG